MKLKTKYLINEFKEFGGKLGVDLTEEEIKKIYKPGYYHLFEDEGKGASEAEEPNKPNDDEKKTEKKTTTSRKSTKK